MRPQQMLQSLDILCHLILHEKKSTVRAALLRRNVHVTLMYNLEKDNALIALCELTKCRTALRRAKEYVGTIVLQLCREPVGGHRPHLLLFLLMKMGPPDAVLRKDAVSGLLKHTSPDCAAATASFLRQILVPSIHIVQELEPSNLGIAFEWDLKATKSRHSYRLFLLTCPHCGTTIC